MYTNTQYKKFAASFQDIANNKKHSSLKHAYLLYNNVYTNQIHERYTTLPRCRKLDLYCSVTIGAWRTDKCAPHYMPREWVCVFVPKNGILATSILPLETSSLMGHRKKWEMEWAQVHTSNPECLVLRLVRLLEMNSFL